MKYRLQIVATVVLASLPLFAGAQTPATPATEATNGPPPDQTTTLPQKRVNKPGTPSSTTNASGANTSSSTDTSGTPSMAKPKTKRGSPASGSTLPTTDGTPSPNNPNNDVSGKVKG